MESLCERSWGKRRGLRSVLDGYADIEVIGEASNGEEAVAMTERLRPSLVLMDINMPKMSGVDATSHIKTAIPRSWSSACRYKRVMNHTWPC